ncbi:hypothetical protein CRENBAI_002872 [Crenichthys baileyi]|uniref:Uncharacterized protein n=1 Tax=Crenichthys baileyi TaxID=28760 RepID=A0AAV9RAD6_9TELE
MDGWMDGWINVSTFKTALTNENYPSYRKQRCLVATSPWRLERQHVMSFTDQVQRARETPRHGERQAGARSLEPGHHFSQPPEQQRKRRRRGGREAEQQQQQEEEERRGGGGGEAGVKFVQVCTSLRKRHFDSSPLRSDFAPLPPCFFLTSSPLTTTTIIIIIILATMSRRKQPNPNKVRGKSAFFCR